MDNFKNLLANLLSNKKQVITFLLIGITVLAIPVGVQLAQQEQTVRSRAATAPSAESQRACDEAIQQNLNITREGCNGSGASGMCTWAGWKSYDEIKAYMEQQGFTGDYGSPSNFCALLDAYWGQKDNKGQCVARVQEEYRKSGAQASLDPWVQNKTMAGVIASERGFRVGALNDKGVGNFAIDNATITVTTPDGQSNNVSNLSLYKPTKTGTYRVVASGGSSNGVRCAAEASVQVTNQCASACSICIIKSHDPAFLVTYREGGWADTSCTNYDRMVDNWCNGVNPTACNNLKAGGCASECRPNATPYPENPTSPTPSPPGGQGGPATPTPVSVAYTGTGSVTCDSNNRATFTWTAFNNAGRQATNYTLRINKSPADWGPDTETPSNTPTDGDRALQAGNNLSMTVALTPGQYLDWTLQAGFADGTVSQQGRAHTGGFTCPGGGGESADCTCQSDSCTSSCTFNKLTNQSITYSSPIKCNLGNTSFSTSPTADNKKSWCNRQNRTKGDANGDNRIDEDDYFYYLRAVTSGNIPPQVNPDFDGDGSVGTNDLAIWKAGKGN